MLKVSGSWMWLAVVLALAGCSSDKSSPSAVAPTLESIEVTPAEVTLAAGDSQSFTATAVYSNGASEILASGVAWSSSDTAVVTIDAASGLATAVAEGSATLRAEFQGRSDTAEVAVTPPPVLNSVQVEPAAVTLLVGDERTFTASGLYSDGNTRALTANVEWSSTTPSVASVDDAAGVVTALAVGETEIRATVDGITGAAQVEVMLYDATVRRTEFGIPHIKASNFGSLGYGLGYAQAQDNLCVLLDDIITDRGERSLYFGRDGSYTIVPISVTANNINSDFFWKMLVTQEAIDHLRDASLPAARAATTGFKDGFNRYIREIKAGGHEGRHAACRDAGWLIELEDDDMYRRYLRLALIASSSVFINDIATAQPPDGNSTSSSQLSASDISAALEQDPGPLGFFTADRPFGSNMYALGSEATTSGMPIMFGNPHFPWSGTERLYIFHATVPGEIDIMGSALYGVPAVLIGFNDHFAWSHTVSTAYRFTFYELTLAPNDPTSYIYDGQVLPMEAVPLTIQVTESDGTTTMENRTLYRSKYGPMMGLNVSGVNIFPWNDAKAYTLRDANFENDRLINQFFHWNRATSLDEFISLHKSVLGIPWVNTIASGPGGKAYYGDVSVVPNVPNTKVQLCSTSVQAQAIAQLVPGLPLLDGSRADCEWDTDDDAPAPGIFGPANLPTLERDDWVHNCNDSYWLTNPAEPITGYNRIIGNENAERSLRTRLCIQQVLRHLDQTGNDQLGATFDANGDKLFDIQELQDTVLSSQIYSGQLARNDVVDTICTFGTVLTQSGEVDVSEACNVLAAWDLTGNLESVGGHIWREFFSSAATLNGRWLTPFLVSDPVNTPRDLNFLQPQMQEAFGNAVKRITDRGHAFNTPMGELQYSGVIGDNFVPIFGGTGTEGAFTIVSPAGGLRPKNEAADDRGGYKITYGNSYIQTVTWEADGAGFKPIADGFVTYSQSTDPASPHFFDFTEEYSAKRWHRFPFREADVVEKTVGDPLVLRE